MSSRLHSKPEIELGPVTLVPLDRADARILGPALAAIDPWARMDYPAADLTAFLESDDPGVKKWGVWRDSGLAGCVAVRDPWLKGPYLQLLGVLPAYQGQGIGSAIMAWFADDAGPEARNLWVVASAFNEQALDFYRAHGFRDVATLPGLVADGFDDILLRRFPITRRDD